jgi:hypothetical protein
VNAQFTRNERPIDRINQEEIFNAMVEHLGEGWSQTQTRSESDFDGFLLFNGERKFIAEAKNRTCTFAQYYDEGYQIDRKKIETQLECSKTYRLPSLLIIRWACGTRGYVNLSEKAVGPVGDRFPYVFRGRTDRVEFADNQYLIPFDLFTKF